MSVANKIKALLKMKDKKTMDLATHLGLSTRQALNNKFNRGSFSADDLIKTAEFLDCELAFIISDNQKITLDTEDLRTEQDTE